MASLITGFSTEKEAGKDHSKGGAGTFTDASEAQLDANGQVLYGMDKELAEKAAAKYDPELEAKCKAWLEALTGERATSRRPARSSLVIVARRRISRTLGSEGGALMKLRRSARRCPPPALHTTRVSVACASMSHTGSPLPEGTFQEALKDGVVLCTAVNAIQPGICPKPFTGKMAFKQSAPAAPLDPRGPPRRVTAAVAPRPTTWLPQCGRATPTHCEPTHTANPPSLLPLPLCSVENVANYNEACTKLGVPKPSLFQTVRRHVCIVPSSPDGYAAGVSGGAGGLRMSAVPATPRACCHHVFCRSRSTRTRT